MEKQSLLIWNSTQILLLENLSSHTNDTSTHVFPIYIMDSIHTIYFTYLFFNIEWHFNLFEVPRLSLRGGETERMSNYQIFTQQNIISKITIIFFFFCKWNDRIAQLKLYLQETTTEHQCQNNVNFNYIKYKNTH